MDPFTRAQRRLNRLIQSQPWVLFATPAVFGVAFFLLHGPLAGWIQRTLGTAQARDLGEGIGTFLTVVGVVYALILGFTFQQAFARQSDLRDAVTAEASSLWNLLLLGRAIGGEERHCEIASRLRVYVDHLLEREFPPDEADPGEAAPLLYDVLTLLHGLCADGFDDEVDRVTLSAIHDEMREATRSRSARLAIAARQIPRIHWFQIELLSTLVMVGFLLLDLRAPALEAVLLALTTSAIAVLYLSMFDLDYPFAGLWRVEPRPLRALRRALVEATGDAAPGGPREGR